MKAMLALEDGTVFEGESFGADGESCGEVVFNTSMSGYQEILTDPSYKGQIVCMTYPLIGNYGVNPEDFESRKPFLEGFVVKECSRIFSNWRGRTSLGDFLKEHKIPGIEGIDTRALTCRIRLAGAMKAVLSTKDPDGKRLVKKAKASPGLVGVDLVREVTCDKPYKWENKCPVSSGQCPASSAGRRSGDQCPAENARRATHDARRFNVVVLDCGVKHNILNSLAAEGCDVTVVPAQTTVDEILAYKPDGILLSNGPGDPSAVPYVVETVRDLIRTTHDPQGRRTTVLFGICLGHQMLGLGLGGKTYKLKFGHHGGNHPVKDLKTGKIAITAQNHGFCVDINSFGSEDIEMTHVNLYDNTPEGMRHKKLPIFSVVYDS